MRVFAAIALAAWLPCATASAQHQASDVITHYRAYRAAIEANDLAGAEAAATAALAAAEATGDRRTAVLALNLASIRLNRDNASEALPPARRAVELAEQDAPNVSPGVARLILGRAELASGDASASERLLVELSTAEIQDTHAAEAYDAAVAVGTWAHRSAQYDQSEQAWTIAQNTANASSVSPEYAAGRARVWRAAAIALRSASNNRRSRIDETPALEALALLEEAATILSRLAAVEAPGGDVTLAQRAYAEALAWRSIIRMRMRADGLEPPAQATSVASVDGVNELQRGPVQIARQRCGIRLIPSGSFNSLLGHLESGDIAGLAIRFQINDAGRVTEERVLVTIGGEAFTRAAERMRWRVERLETSPPDCRMDMMVIAPLSFIVRD